MDKQPGWLWSYAIRIRVCERLLIKVVAWHGVIIGAPWFSGCLAERAPITVSIAQSEVRCLRG
jgi:hypothetical protein